MRPDDAALLSALADAIGVESLAQEAFRFVPPRVVYLGVLARKAPEDRLQWVDCDYGWRLEQPLGMEERDANLYFGDEARGKVRLTLDAGECNSRADAFVICRNYRACLLMPPGDPLFIVPDRDIWTELMAARMV